MSEKLMKIEMGLPSLHDRQHQIISPILRLVLCFTALVDSSASVEKVCTSSYQQSVYGLIYIVLCATTNLEFYHFLTQDFREVRNL